MGRTIKETVQPSTPTTLPRVVSSVTRSVEFSSPALGRPKVFWTQGINPAIVRELWPSHGELPYQKEPLPRHFCGAMACNLKLVKRYTLGTVKKLVIYERAHPEIRLVLLLGSECHREGKTWGPIIQSRVERDRGVDPKQSRALEQRLWDEVCRVEKRGRPRGTGHSIRRRLLEWPINPQDINRLRKAGLGDKDIQILFGRSQDKTFERIGQELTMSAQAVWKRWTRRVEPALKQLNPKFSRRSFELASLD
jgi:hypothetical protein